MFFFLFMDYYYIFIKILTLNKKGQPRYTKNPFRHYYFPDYSYSFDIPPDLSPVSPPIYVSVPPICPLQYSCPKQFCNPVSRPLLL